MEQLSVANDKVSLLLDQGLAMVMNYLPKALLAIVTLLIGLWLIKRAVAVIDRQLGSRDPTLNSFLCGLISITLKVMLLISVASMVGIATTSFIAVIGAAGLAVGLALQGSLANFAGGVLILIFKPFKVGDAIEAQGFVGAVAEIQVLYTVLNTFDNRRIVIPNGSLSNGTVTNISAYDTRRCDMSFGIGYSDDIDKAKAVCKRLVEEDVRVLAEPAPLIVVGALGESSVELTVRVWTKSSDLWPLYWDMQEKVKKTFDAEGISIPFPQRDVHLYQAG
jgi:small conductance mechanosensitive channel